MADFMQLYFAHEEARREGNLAKRRRRRLVRVTFPPTHHADHDFVALYRLSPEVFRDLVEELVPLLPVPLRRDALSVESQILAALAFYASGSYQRYVGQNVDLSIAQQTMSKCVRRVTDALNHPRVYHKHVKFPQSAAARQNIKIGYFEGFGMPGVIGSVDGTHVAVIKPRENEERFFNRKNYHSLNVQVVCDSDLNILAVDPSNGGASHDAFIFNNSELRVHMEQLVQAGESSWLLGDSGYAQREHMMTPIENAVEGSPEAHYNEVQMSARNTIERTFGVLKGRWRCLLAARELYYDPLTAANIVNACCVLHNMCNRAAVPPEVPFLEPEVAMEEAARQVAPVVPVPVPENLVGGHGGVRNGPAHQGREARTRLVRVLRAQ